MGPPRVSRVHAARERSGDKVGRTNRPGNREWNPLSGASTLATGLF